MQGNFDNYPTGLSAFLAGADGYALGPGEPNREVRSALDGLDLEQAFAPRKIENRTMARACHSGLWLLHNFLDQSHSISQNINDATGSFWHGIMHRREGDFSNAKYWFRRVGEHEIYPDLAAAAHQISSDLFSSGNWDPFEYVDLCEASVIHGNGDHDTLVLVAHREWELLFDYCFQHAIGAA